VILVLRFGPRVPAIGQGLAQVAEVLTVLTQTPAFVSAIGLMSVRMNMVFPRLQRRLQLCGCAVAKFGRRPIEAHAPVVGGYQEGLSGPRSGASIGSRPEVAAKTMLVDWV
jgi:hypothetical protein